MKKFGLQLYTVRDFMKTEEDIKATFEKIKNMGYDQVQTAGCAIPYEKFGQLAKEAGLEIIGTHDNFQKMYEDPELAVENHRFLGTTNAGIGGLWPNSVAEFEEFIKNANTFAKEISKQGMKFTYHNHSHEFIKQENGKTFMDMLVEGLDKENSSFVLDTYWVQHGGGDVRYWIEKLAGRVDILHLKDMKRIDGNDNVQQITEIGNGNLYWEGILETAEKCGVKYYIVEQDINWTPDCFTSAKFSIDYLRSLGF